MIISTLVDRGDLAFKLSLGKVATKEGEECIGDFIVAGFS